MILEVASERTQNYEQSDLYSSISEWLKHDWLIFLRIDS